MKAQALPEECLPKGIRVRLRLRKLETSSRGANSPVGIHFVRGLVER